MMTTSIVVLFFHFLQLGQCSKKTSSYLQLKSKGSNPQSIPDNYDKGTNNSFYLPELDLNYAQEDNLTVANTNRYSANCQIDLNKESVKWMPLFYSTETNSFLMPMKDASPYQPGDYKQLKKGKYRKIPELNSGLYNKIPRWLKFSKAETNKVFAVCPGARFKSADLKKMQVICSNGMIIAINDQNEPKNKGNSIAPEKKLKFSELSCTNSIKETILPTDKFCGPLSGQGKVTHIGWTREHDKTKSSFMAQITVCHDQLTENTYFTNHTLYGMSIDSRDVGKSRQVPFKEGGLKFYASSSASKAYKISSQRQLFSKLLPDSKEKSKIFNPSNRHNLYLSKGHLSPEADFIWKEWQDASYYYFNAAPQWQSFNNGNWKAVEEAVRKYAAKNRINLKVFTGTEGQLRVGKSRIQVSLATKTDSFKKVTNDLIPAPLHFWKLVYNYNDNTAIIFVGLNDPHISKEDINENLKVNDSKYRSLCPNDEPRLCERAGWNFAHRKDISKGYVYCCSVGGFSEILPWATKTAYIPHNVNLLAA